jgi:hypothetical protein
MDGDPGGPLEAPEPWGLLASARRIGGYVWTEQRLFEVVGSWVADASDPGAAVLFDVQSRHHAGHARTFVERLPELRELPRDRVVTAPAGGWAAFVHALGDVGPAEVDRLAVLAEVVTPHLVETYRSHAERISAVADAPLLRSLAAVVVELESDRDVARGLLRQLDVDGRGDGGAAAERARDALVATDGLAGPTLDVDALA